MTLMNWNDINGDSDSEVTITINVIPVPSNHCPLFTMIHSITQFMCKSFISLSTTSFQVFRSLRVGR